MPRIEGNLTPVTVTCPQCGRPTSWRDNPVRPFCSERCRQLDLGDWATEKHRLPVESDGASSKAEPEEVPDPASKPKPK